MQPVPVLVGTVSIVEAACVAVQCERADNSLVSKQYSEEMFVFEYIRMALFYLDQTFRQMVLWEHF
jgi:hypothetical protein